MWSYRIAIQNIEKDSSSTTVLFQISPCLLGNASNGGAEYIESRPLQSHVWVLFGNNQVQKPKSLMDCAEM